MKRERVTRVTLGLDGDGAGRKATRQLKEKLTAAGLSVRVMPYPPNVKDANELLVSCNGNAVAVFAKYLDEAEPRPTPPPTTAPALAPRTETAPDKDRGTIALDRAGIAYQARVASNILGRLRTTVKATRGAAFHVDTIDLYSARARSEFARRASKALSAELDVIEADLL